MKKKNVVVLKKIKRVKDPKVKPKKGVLKVKKDKVSKVMHEYKEGELHSGSKHGPVVDNPKQAIAIALSEARKKGQRPKGQRPKTGGKKRK